MMSKSVRYTREKLCTLFPMCFKTFGAPKLPLKIGIFNDILARAPDISRTALRRALYDYTSGLSYCYAMENHSCRYDLDGNMTGFITPNERKPYIFASRLTRGQRLMWREIDRLCKELAESQFLAESRRVERDALVMVGVKQANDITALRSALDYAKIPT